MPRRIEQGGAARLPRAAVSAQTKASVLPSAVRAIASG